MHKATASIEIDAPASRIYEFMQNPNNLPRVFPSLVEVQNVTMGRDGANAFDFTYKMAGVRLHGHSQTLETVPGKKVVTRTTGIPATFRWTYEARGNKTTMAVEVDYSIPAPVIGAVAEAVIAKINAHELAVVLQNVKALQEAQRSVGNGVAASA